MRVLAISGSLRAGSSNTVVLDALALLAPATMDFVFDDGLAALPHFNADLDGAALPMPVRALRDAVAGADALAISSPEYARGVAGSFKNVLDWLVGGPEFVGKPVIVLNTSPRASLADAAIRLTLATMSARLIGDGSVVVPLLGRNLTARQIAADPALFATLRGALAVLADAAGQA